MKKFIFILCAFLSTQTFADQLRDHIDKAIQYRDAGKVVEAISEFEKALKIEPRIADIYVEIGYLKGCPDSIEYYIAATELDSENVNAFYNLGACYHKLEDGVNAVKYYKKVLGFEPNDVALNYSVGNFLQEQNKYKEAVEYYNRVLAIEPDHYFAALNLGNAYTSIDKYNLALEAFQKAAAIAPSLAPAYLNMYNPYSLQNKEKEGRAVLEKGGLQALKNNNLDMIKVAHQMLKNFHPDSKLIAHLEKKLTEKP